MRLPLRLSITWKIRLLNGFLSALVLVALIVLAQARIHAVLYGAVDRTLSLQAIDVSKRPGEDPRPENGWGRFRREQGGYPMFPGRPEGGGEWDGSEQGSAYGQPRPMQHPPRPDPPGPEVRRGRPVPEPRPIQYGAISMIPPRHLPLDGIEGPQPWSAAGWAAALTRRTDVRTEVDDAGKRVRVYSLRHDDGPGPGEIIQTAALLEPTESTLSEIDTALYMLLFPLALIAAVLGAFLTEMAFAPVRQLAQAVHRIEPANLSARLPEPGGDDAFDRLAQMLNALLARMEEAFARQKRFTGSASHELRTPLSVIKSATSLLLEEPDSLTPLQQRALDRADKSADRANRLVTDLLTLARTENNTLPLQMSTVNVRSIVRDTVSEVQGTRSEASVPVICNVPEDAVLRTDADHFRRLLQNLLSNAIRHTSQGQVTVAASLFQGMFHLSVRDTGEGIPPDALARLGEPFYRPDAARAREQGGTGLGLSLCKGIVSALGGVMKIESIIGQGTTVSVTLPQVPYEPTAQGR